MFKKIILGTTIFAMSLFAQGDSFTKKVRVDYSKPVYEVVEEVIPHRHNKHCFEEYEVKTPIYNNRHSSYKDENSIGIDTIIGAASGVIIGNQIGKGNGKVAAKVIGGILGATVANNMRNYERVEPRDYRDDNYYYETKTRNICKHKKRKVIRKNILKGYENYFSYNGRTYSKFTEGKISHVRVTTRIHF